MEKGVATPSLCKLWPCGVVPMIHENPSLASPGACPYYPSAHGALAETDSSLKLWALSSRVIYQLEAPHEVTRLLGHF